MKVALVGNPNSGKTALFNLLTGSRQKVGNYPGVTVERKSGFARYQNQVIEVLDLPGTYSLSSRSMDEKITRDVLQGSYEHETAPDQIILVVDATSLERSLAFALEVRALKKPMILALNMMDLAQKRGLVLNIELLSKELGLKVIPTVAIKNQGSKEILEAILVSPSLSPETSSIRFDVLPLKERFQEVDRILKAVTIQGIKADILTRKIDRVMLHPVSGVLILIAVLFLLFQAVFQFSGYFQGAIESAITTLADFARLHIAEGFFRDLITDGVIAGVGSVVVFLPQILTLFLFILALEDSGYMARAAFLMDTIMKKTGLQGRAFIPLLSSYACAIPGIMATRTIEDPRDRLTTILIAPLTTCSARLPVYTLLIAAFIPNETLGGIFSLQGVVLFALYAVGILATLALGALFRKILLKGKSLPIVFELPSYKRPSLKNIGLGLIERSLIFIKRAGTIILSLSVILWLMCTFPKAPEGATEPAIHYSFAGKFGHWIEPVIQPLGFDWRVGIALVPGLAAREVMVSSLATVYSVETQGQDESQVQEKLGALLQKNWSLPTALSLLVWYIFACQCISTLGVTKRETNSLRWPAFMFVYMTALAYLFSFVTFQVAKTLL